MNIIKYLDNDELNQPNTTGGEVFVNDSSVSAPLSRDQLIRDFPPVQHAPRRVPVAIRERLKETLEDLERQEILPK